MIFIFEILEDFFRIEFQYEVEILYRVKEEGWYGGVFVFIVVVILFFSVIFEEVCGGVFLGGLFGEVLVCFVGMGIFVLVDDIQVFFCVYIFGFESIVLISYLVIGRVMILSFQEEVVVD